MRHVLLIVLLCAVCATPAATRSISQAPEKLKTQIVLLGTGTPNADPERFGPSVAVVVNDTPYIVDSGPGVVRRAAAAFRQGIKGLAVKNLGHLFITHLHSDHTAGLPDLMLTPWVLDRSAPLEIYGPRGIKAMTDHILAAYREDIEIRLNGGEPSNKTGYKAIAHEIKPGVIYKDSNVTVTSFQVDHGSWQHAYGFRFETPDRTIVISGDCRPSSAIIDNCKGCDVLIHEVYSTTGFATRPPDWQKYHSRYHTSSSELADLANKARPGLLVLYHQLFWGTSEEDLLKEVRQNYRGKVVSGHDLDVY